MTRRITVALTEPQYRALAGAVDGELLELEERWSRNDGSALSRARTLERAWEKIRSAWGRT